MSKRGGSTRSGTLTLSKFAKLDVSPLWTAFWNQAERSGPMHDPHYLWRGPVDGRGRAIFPASKGPPLPARRIAWVHQRRELAAGEELQPVCGRAACIRPDHQEVVRGER